ncbi:MAG TPA: M2 family metallopeptidase, partial [Anaerolineales bacterium]|nr:M2 family metallopeptidase [Anaerolineales bacterium]
MTSSLVSFIEETTRLAAPLEKAYNLAEWNAASLGTPEAIQAQEKAQTAYMRFWADPKRYQTAKELSASANGVEPLLARQIRLIYLTAGMNQQDQATLEQIARVEGEIRQRYFNFRAIVDGQSLSDNRIDEILATTSDGGEARRVWEGSKQVGAEVADRVRKLARLRNQAAQAHGFRDHFHRSLTLSEIDESQLLAIFDDLDRQSRRPFEQVKSRIDQLRADRFGVQPGDLRPWHYSNRFFQEPDQLGEIDFDTLFSAHDPTTLATATYDGLGMDVRPILARSDLYAREGKNQHAFCTHIDRQGDIRTLNNLERNRRWHSTLHHELGHAVYEQYLDDDLPWLLRTPPHLLSTEAVAILMGSVTMDKEWLTKILGVPSNEAAHVAQAAHDQNRATRLVFARWCLVMTHFERGLYGNPEADLDSLWWDLAERYQLLRRPDGRQAPDWAAKIHVALHPVYYHNYELGDMVAAQFQASIRQHANGFVGRPA